MTDLLIATNNRGKLHEFEQLLTGLTVSLRDLSYFGVNVELRETGSTFEENVAIKALRSSERMRRPLGKICRTARMPMSSTTITTRSSTRVVPITLDWRFDLASGRLRLMLFAVKTVTVELICLRPRH